MTRHLLTAFLVLASAIPARAQGTSPVHAGMYSARIEWATGATGSVSIGRVRDAAHRIDIAGRLGHVLQWTAWARVDESTPDLGLRLSWYNAAGTKLSMYSVNQGVPPSEWTEFSIQRAVPADAVTVDTLCRVLDPGAIVIDDVELLDLGPDGSPWPTPEAIPVSNPGFEDWPGAATDPPTDWVFNQEVDALGSINRVEMPTPVPTPATQAQRWEIYR